MHLLLAQPAPEGFEPVTGPAAESISAPPLVIAAYAFIWIALAVYLWMLRRRQDALGAEIEALKGKLDRK